MLYRIEQGQGGQRADKVLASCFKNMSRAQLQHLLDNGRVLKNGVIVNKKDKLSDGDCLEIHFLEQKESSITPQDIALNILYEDEHLIAIDKASGHVVHPGNGTGQDTMVHALLHHCKGQLSRAGGDLRPGVVHRLDKETTGVILFAKTDETYFKLVRMFSDRDLKKEYSALVIGIPNIQSGSLHQPIGRHPINRTKMTVLPKGRPAHTDWKIAQSFRTSLGNYSLIKCLLHTGRTHQIRVHLSFLGHPIVGDKLYGYKNQLQIPIRVLLHAYRISFLHPISNKPMTLESNIPQDFQDVIQLLLKNAIT